MINFKTIAKVLFVALFICAYSSSGWAQMAPNGKYNINGQVASDYNPNPVELNPVEHYNHKPDSSKMSETADGALICDPKCKDGQNCINGKCKDVESVGRSSVQPADFCSGDLGLFSSLIKTGQTIFQRLRDLIYVVAGFGIIAVAVGGFFGNLNWKWLGAIVISLVVVATAGEVVVLITGCEQFGSSLVTNTLTHPTGMSTAEYQDKYTEPGEESGWIKWNDKVAREHPHVYAGHDTRTGLNTLVDDAVDDDGEYVGTKVKGVDLEAPEEVKFEGKINSGSNAFIDPYNAPYSSSQAKQETKGAFYNNHEN